MNDSSRPDDRPATVLQVTVFAAGVVLVAGIVWQYRLWSQQQDGKARDQTTPPAPMARLRQFEALIAEGEDAVPVLLEQLAADDLIDRRYAALALGRIGPAALAALPALEKCLDDVDPEFRADALAAIGRISEDIDRYVPAVIQRLADPERPVQWAAMSLLLEIGPPAAPQLASALREYDAQAVDRALSLLTGIAHYDSRVLEALRDFAGNESCDPPLRTRAVRMILASGDATVDEVRQGLLDGSISSHEVVAFIGSRDAAPLLPALLELIDSRSEAQRPMAGYLAVVESLGDQARNALPVLRRVIEDRSVLSNDRTYAAEIAWKLGAPARELLPELEFMLDVPDSAAGNIFAAMAVMDPPYARRRFLEWSQSYQSPRDGGMRLPFYQRFHLDPGVERFYAAMGATILPHLRAQFDWPSREQSSDRLSALRGLAALGVLAAPQVPRLVELLHETPAARESLTEIQIIDTIRKIGAADPASVGRLTALLDNEPLLRTWTTRRGVGQSQMEILDCLIALGNPGGEVERRLKASLRSDSLPLSVGAAMRLVRRGQEFETCLAVLKKGVVEGEHPVWIEAAQALGGLGPPAAPALPELAQQLGRPAGPARLEVIGALSDIAWPADDETPEIRVAVEGLETCLTDPDVEIRRDAARALAEFGPAAKRAIPALEQAAAQWRNRVSRRITLAGEYVAIGPVESDSNLNSPLSAPRRPHSTLTVRDAALNALERIRRETP